MKATEASNRFGRLLDQARSEPVLIEKQGRGVAVMVSAEEYSRMEREIENYDELRLQQSIADLKAGRLQTAETGFSDLKDRHKP